MNEKNQFVYIILLPLFWLIDQLIRLLEEINALPEIYKIFDQAVMARVELLDNLPLSRSRKERIKLAIEDSARAYLPRNLSSTMLSELATKYRRLICISLAVVAAIGLTLFIQHPMPNPAKLHAGGVIGAAILLFLLAIAKAYINYPLRNSRYLNLMYFLEAIIALAAVTHWKYLGNWTQHGMSLLAKRASNHFERTLLFTPAVEAIHLALWIFAIGSIVAVVNVVLRMAMASLFKKDYRYGKSTYYSSVLIQGFLEVAAELSAKPKKDRTRAHLQRNKLIRDLNELAYIAAGPWAKYARSSYRFAGADLRRCAGQIAMTINEWQLELALMNNSSAVAERITQAIQDAAVGDWILIKPRGEYHATVGASRVIAVMRRLVSAAVAIGIALASYVYMAHRLSGFYLQAIVITCFGFAAAQLFSLMDPSSPSTLEAATRIGQIFRKP